MQKTGLKVRVQRAFAGQQPAAELRARLLLQAARGVPAAPSAPRSEQVAVGWLASDVPGQCWAQVCALTDRHVLAIHRPQQLQFYGAL